MPELPEVEVTRRQLLPLLVGRRIASVVTTRPSYFFLTAPAVLRRKLPGRTVLALDRIGKYLLAGLDSGERLLLHLGMTGEIVRAGAIAADEHTHLRLRFHDTYPGVDFRDERKFGKVQLLAAGASPKRLARLGPDALRISAEQLRVASRKRRIPIKTLLLDQAVLAGVGNIYADEALLHRKGPPHAPRRERVTRAEFHAPGRGRPARAAARNRGRWLEHQRLSCSPTEATAGIRRKGACTTGKGSRASAVEA